MTAIKTTRAQVADDATPIDEVWLAVQFKADDLNWFYLDLLDASEEPARLFFFNRRDKEIEWFARLGTFDIRVITRGNVRRLLEALGVKK